MFRVINTDNFGGDYPDERFVENVPRFTTAEQAQRLADACNAAVPDSYDRYWRVVDEDYILIPGFEP